MIEEQNYWNKTPQPQCTPWETSQKFPHCILYSKFKYFVLFLYGSEMIRPEYFPWESWENWYLGWISRADKNVGPPTGNSLFGVWPTLLFCWLLWPDALILFHQEHDTMTVTGGWQVPRTWSGKPIKGWLTWSIRPANGTCIRAKPNLHYIHILIMS